MTSGTIGAGALVSELDFTIDTGAKQYYALGSAQFQAALPLASKVTGNITTFANDANLSSIYNLTSQGTLVVAIGTHTVTFGGVYETKGSCRANSSFRGYK